MLGTGQIAAGWVYGTGAAVTISCGFIPDDVLVTNKTDGDRWDWAQLNYQVPYTSGGTATIAAGDTLVGATSGATCKVKQVLITSGSFAAGTAAGTLIVEDIVGTIGSENMYRQGNGSSTDDCTVTVNVTSQQASTTAVAAVASNQITPYAGSSTAAAGFTIGSDASESGKLLRWIAIRG